MSIYTNIITDPDAKCIKNYKPTRLYIKRHSITGLRYFGKTINEDVHSYLGSGKRWSNHYNKHGKEFVVTDWVSDWFYDPIEIQKFALTFSKLFNIVESDEWGNLVPENGLTGAGFGEIGRKKYLITINDPEWKATIGKEAFRKISVAIKTLYDDPEWNSTIGKEKEAKRQATISTDEWQNTTGLAMRSKMSNTQNDPTWKETKGKKKSEQISSTRRSLEWKEAGGYKAIQKATESTKRTKSDPEWIETVGKEAARKIGISVKKTKSDPEWKATKGIESKEKMSKTKSDPEWIETVGKEAAAKISKTKSDPEWKATKGTEAAAKRSTTISTPEWKEKHSKTCEHCGKFVIGGNFTRWHGDNCKLKPRL